MFNQLIKVLLSITALAPILLTYSFVLYLEKNSNKLIFILVIITIILILLCYSLLYFAKRKLEKIRFQPKTIKSADSNIISFIIAYLIPFISLNSSVIDLKVLTFVTFIILITIFRTHGYHINPLLSVVNYHFYEVTTNNGITYILISKKTLRNVSSVKLVTEISEYTLLDIT